ncbi:MAG: hypothetical protein WCD43_01445 [Candidatus Acidiferrales bacterium]
MFGKVALILTSVISIASCSAAYAETHDFSIQLSDLSPASSPLQASGQASFHVDVTTGTVFESCALDGRLRNASSKAILAFEASLDLLPGYSGGVHQDYDIDYIFDDHLLEPGSQIPIQERPQPWQMPTNGQISPRKARAEFRVTFVQFADGSTFGKSSWGDALSGERKTKIGIMTALLQAYQSRKEVGLSSAIADGLAKSDNSISVKIWYRELKDIMDAKGAKACVTEIESRLANAKSRMDVL